MNYADARKLEKPKKVLSYENTFAKLECGHRVYFWRRNGKAPKNLLCAKCISERMDKDEPLTLTDLPRPWSTDEMKPLPYEVYKDFEQGQPFSDER